MMPVRWGIVGAAKIALNRVIPAMQLTEHCDVRAIASRSIDTARAAASRFGIERAYGSYQELIDDPDIEAVYIPLPNTMHVEWSAKAMLAGKHVLCEKPVALSAREAEPLLAVRDKTGRLIEEAFAFRSHPQWPALRQVLASGEIGSIRSMQVTLAYCNTDPTFIVNRADVGGGALYDIGCYAIAGCRYAFANDPTRAFAALSRDPAFNTDVLSSAILEFPEGHASFTVTTQGGATTGGTHQHLGIVGSKGWLRMEFPFSHSVPSPCRILIGHDKSIGSQHAREIAFPVYNQYQLQAERFSRLVRGDKVEHFPLETAIAGMRVIDALGRSARSGCAEVVG